MNHSSNMFHPYVSWAWIKPLTATDRISPRLHFVHLLRAMRLPEGWAFSGSKQGKQGMVGGSCVFFSGS